MSLMSCHEVEEMLSDDVWLSSKAPTLRMLSTSFQPDRNSRSGQTRSYHSFPCSHASFHLEGETLRNFAILC